MKPLSKQVQLFLIEADERALSGALISRCPNVAFVDDNVWDGDQPILAPSIEACRSGFVYIWDQTIVESLPTLRRKDGRLEGPTAGVVVQVVRSRQQADLLLSGRVAAGSGGQHSRVEAAFRGLAQSVFAAVEEVTVSGLVAVDPDSGLVLHEKVKEYRAGHSAIQWVRADDRRWFKDRSTRSFYRPSK